MPPDPLTGHPARMWACHLPPATMSFTILTIAFPVLIFSLKSIQQLWNLEGPRELKSLMYRGSFEGRAENSWWRNISYSFLCFSDLHHQMLLTTCVYKPVLSPVEEMEVKTTKSNLYSVTTSAPEAFPKLSHVIAGNSPQSQSPGAPAL